MTGRGGCECGASAPCVDTWYEALAQEHEDPEMAAWHAPLVCTFVLQHPSRNEERFADVQFRLLQFFLDRGVVATNRLARHQVARNKSGGPGYDMTPLEPYHALPQRLSLPRFALGVADLRDADGGFVGDGHVAYGERMRQVADATVAGYLAPDG
ncbi:DUF5946 family protein [Nocardia otitidiscaviarum]|uniref:DUF5946 family protein n=1 Tax=Nocardia otitidiscaviarum TaxID=1823 RepID=UPI0018939F53|nr:DUF5946 family protein [Nocardia otitidiscaviarum]MBF6183412.1 hypothetical protein [Nocardia otitidiscaviarum]